MEPVSIKELYFQTAINIVKELNKLHKDFDYQIWHKNDMHDVYVNENNQVFHYKYYNEGKILKQEIK